MRVVGMLPIRNEMGRYLDEALGKLSEICDVVVAVDDASDDGTPEYIEKNFSNVELKRRKESSFSKEWALRAPLLERVLAKDPDWVVALDADEVLNEYGAVFLRQVLEAADGADGIAVPLHDMWGPDVYRSDMWWTAHRRFWLIAVRGRILSRTSFEKRDHHSGRFPPLPPDARVNQTGLVKIKHMGWARPEDREAKYRRYMEHDPEGKWGSLDHYRSILDPSPNLKSWLKAHELGLIS